MRISIVLDKDQEDYDNGAIKELIPFPTKATIDFDRNLFFWEEVDGTTVLEWGDRSLNILEAYEKFKKKYVDQFQGKSK